MNKQKMLIVDDNLFNRQVLTELFDNQFDIIQAGDGIEALVMMREHAQSISVVMLDIVMPKKDGLDVLREMQKEESLKAIPVIVTSSAGDDLFRMKAFELGAVDYLAAPFNPILAKLRVKSVLATKEYDRLRLQKEILNMQKKEESGYRMILEDANTAVLEFDCQGQILRYDAIIEKELAGNYDQRQLVEIFREDNVAEPGAIADLQLLFDKVIFDDSVESDNLDMLLRTSAGSRSWFQLKLLKKIDDATGEVKLVMAITNIDQQKREEEATRAQLIRALNSSENANIAKSEFMSRMSHEIRTPLNAIIGFLNLARNNLNNSKLADEYLEKTEYASKHLLSIVNDVLDISAIESGRMTISYESCNLRELINGVTAIIYPSIHRKNIQFQIMLDGIAEENVMGDKLRISQILLNLLSNAVKFTPQNGSVVFSIKQRPTNSNRVLMDFIVQDTGIGMTPEFLKRLGKPFEQQSEEIARRYGGSGLGLSITKKLVALMNGAMTIDSKVGHGSTFTISLPMGTEEADLSAKRIYTFGNIRVLVIDQNKSSAESIRICFRSLGCECDCAVSGRRALELCQFDYYDLILMDWKLPDMDGRSIIEAILQILDGEPKFAIMAYDDSQTSLDMTEDICFVNKPVFKSSVLDLLLKLFGKYEVIQPVDDVHDFHDKHLLLAEDNNMNLEIATAILSQMGFTIVPVFNGKEAYEAFICSDPGDYDAIILDVHMPVMDGYTATRRIRESGHPLAKRIPIIAMTADAFDEDVEAALACGMSDHIAKPIDIDRMSKTLAKHLL